MSLRQYDAMMGADILGIKLVISQDQQALMIERDRSSGFSWDGSDAEKQ